MGKKGGGIDDGGDYTVSNRKNQKNGGRGGKKDRKNIEETSDIEDDISSYVSNMSYQNNLERESIGEGSTGESGIEDNDVMDQQFDCALEGASVKNTVVREKNFKILREMLAGKILGDVLTKRKMEVAEVLEKSLKNGKASEKCTSALIAILYALQIGSDDKLDGFYDAVCPLMVTLTNDKEAGGSVRGKVLFYNTLLCYVSSDSADEYKACMARCIESMGSEYWELANNALSSAGLLLSIFTPMQRMNYITGILPIARTQLQHTNVEVRISAGELIALCFEYGLTDNDEFSEEVEDYDAMVEELEVLATDSAKYRAKKDRKQQRSSFRDILNTILGDESSVEESIKISTQESYDISSWSERFQYNAFKQVLGSGTSVHIQYSPFLREILGLGAPVLRVTQLTKAEKHEQKKLNAACCKARQKNLAKHRDKRMVC